MIFTILIGIGLSAAAGFRVFTPLLMTGLAAKFDYVTLEGGMEWMGSTPALVAFAVALFFEVSAYYIPWVDNVVKMLAAPFALIAGTLLTASFIGDLDPFFTWSIAIIAGGGTASVTQVAASAVRGASTVVTGGLGNFLVSIIEGISAVVMTFLALVMPVVAVLLVLVLLFFLFKLISNLKSKKQVAT